MIIITSSIPGEREHVRASPLVAQTEHRPKIAADGLNKNGTKEVSRARVNPKLSTGPK